jgi:hypothetical protein
MAVDFIDDEAEGPPPQPNGLPLEIVDARPSSRTKALRCA